MIDVLFFSILAIFVILKLRKILGNEQSEGFSAGDTKSSSRLQKYSKIIKIKTKESQRELKNEDIRFSANITSLSEALAKKKTQLTDDEIRAEVLLINPNEQECVIKDVINLSKKHPFFSYKALISGLQGIKEQIFASYSNQSLGDLSVGLNASMFEKFLHAIKENESNNLLEKVEILRFEDLKINGIKIKSKHTEVSFSVTTKQLRYRVKADDKAFVDGSKSVPVSRKEEWTISDSGDCLSWKVVGIKPIEGF